MLVALLVADYKVYKMHSDIGDIDMTPDYAIKTKESFKLPVRLLTAIVLGLTMLAIVVSGWGTPIYNLVAQP